VALEDGATGLNLVRMPPALWGAIDLAKHQVHAPAFTPSVIGSRRVGAQ
jgi:hypothetical protein